MSRMWKPKEIPGTAFLRSSRAGQTGQVVSGAQASSWRELRPCSGSRGPSHILGIDGNIGTAGTWCVGAVHPLVLKQPRDPNLPGCLSGYNNTASDLYWALHNLTRHQKLGVLAACGAGAPRAHNPEDIEWWCSCSLLGALSGPLASTPGLTLAVQPGHSRGIMPLDGALRSDCSPLC
ncbi:uncharacterized protein LOC116546097 isoform X2 [Sapajus apella]|uniref:Uncharacterized protein LOC116546097 isoform X2 n=1 Tax=Sapajus apella TaxID=9515 RepID=A0A6J3HF32_SAPAP|nr:uncharacterized protein LOC116546097 isoform X2 [Sapajus apella]